ncbi:hypothetical protein [Pilimelia columellifera]|uniref:hypothetical protein n=1 Tax=Pilimelia columellifera TaxID=706574 RepID=UPI0031DFB9EA
MAGIAARIRELIDKSGLTVIEYATQAGVDPDRLACNLAAGGGFSFSALDVALIANYAKVSTRWLLTGERRMIRLVTCGPSSCRAGWRKVGGRSGAYVRLAEPDSERHHVLVPVDPTAGDYQDLIDATVGDLRHRAETGRRAQLVLDTINDNPEGAPK